MIHGRLPLSVQYRSSAIVQDERVYHLVYAIFDRGETSFRAASIHVPHGSSARNENQAVQSGMRLKCSLHTLVNRERAFARSQDRKIAHSQTNIHERPAGCLQCGLLPFSCAIRPKRSTPAASME